MKEHCREAKTHRNQIYPIERIRLIEEAIAKLWHSAPSAPQRDSNAAGLANLVPELSRYSSVVEDAEAALRGNSSSIQHLFATLNTRLRASECCSKGSSGSLRRIPAQPAPRHLNKPALNKVAKAFIVGTVSNGASVPRAFRALDRQVCRYRILDELADVAEAFLEGDTNPAPARQTIGGALEGRTPRDFDDLCDPGWPFETPESDPFDVRSNVWEELWFQEAWSFWTDFQKDLKEHAWSLGAPQPATGCPGQTITLIGTNVGTEPRAVLFPERRSTGRISQQPTQWEPITLSIEQAVRITVPIPENAGCGHLGLDLPRTGDAGVSIPGNNLEAYFDGALPTIRRFQTGGFTTSVVEPDETVILEWDVCPSHSEIDLQVSLVGAPPGTPPLFEALNLNAGTHQSAPFTVPNLSQTSELQFEITARNDCERPGDPPEQRRLTLTVHRRAKVRLDGVEITQGTQFLRAQDHLTRSEGTDNSVPLVHRKPTLVRVYFSCDQVTEFNMGTVENLRIQLHCHSNNPQQEDVVLQAQSDRFTAGNDRTVRTQRGSLEASALFLLDNDWTLAGRQYSFRAVVDLVEDPLDIVDPDHGSLEVPIIIFQERWEPSVRMVRYRHQPEGSGERLAPTNKEGHAAIQRVRRGLPVRRMRISIPTSDRVVDFDGDLSDPDGWSAILRDLFYTATYYIDSAPCIWNGVLSAEVFARYPSGTAATGITFSSQTNAGSVTDCRYTVFLDGLPETGIHEYGHLYNLGHPGGGGVLFPGLADFDEYSLPNYHSGSLGYVARSCGEFGVDVEAVATWLQSNQSTPTPLVFDPLVTRDIMAFGSPRWPSPYFFQTMFRRFDPLDAAFDEFWDDIGFDRGPAQPRDRFFLSGTVSKSSGRTELETIYHRVAHAEARFGSPTSLTWQQLNGQDEVLESTPVTSLHGNPWTIDFLLTPPRHQHVQSLVLSDGDKELVRIKAASAPPTIADFDLDTDGKKWHAKWTAASKDGRDLLFHLSLTVDGLTWSPLCRWIPLTNFTIDAAQLPGGKNCQVRLLATDGFDTVSVDSKPFEHQTVPATLHLASPLPGSKWLSRHPVLLEAQAWIHGKGDAVDTAFRWESDIQGDLGTGSYQLKRLRPGSHKITVTLEEETGSISTTSRKVEVH